MLSFEDAKFSSLMIRKNVATTDGPRSATALVSAMVPAKYDGLPPGRLVRRARPGKERMVRTLRIGVAVAAAAVAGGICLAVPAAAGASGTPGLGRAQTNRYNAQGCEQDGFQTRVEAERESAFKNAGACTSHTARDGTLRAGDGQVTFTGTPTYPCPAPETRDCWGSLQMSGVPTNTFALITMSVTTTGTGS